MNGELSPNAQAILLLTAPLLAGKSQASVTPLPLGDYNNLVRHLRDTEMQPADLLDSEGLRELDSSWSGLRTRRTLADVRQLLERGFLLAQALERWSARAIWVVTRPDDDYPSRLRKKMRGKAPPVLYGCGGRDALDGGGLAVVGSRKVNELLIEYTERVGQLAAEAEVPIVSGGAHGVVRGAGKWSEPGTPADLREILFDGASQVSELAGPPQRELFPSEPKGTTRVPVVREGEPTVLAERMIEEDDSESSAEARVPVLRSRAVDVCVDQYVDVGQEHGESAASEAGGILVDIQHPGSVVRMVRRITRLHHCINHQPPESGHDHRTAMYAT